VHQATSGARMSWRLFSARGAAADALGAPVLLLRPVARGSKVDAVAVLLALIAAMAYGVSDFLAGLMARRASVFLVTLISEAAATIVVGAALPFTGGVIDGTSLLWGGIAGLGGGGGAMFLYRGLARGSMSIVGPVSAVVTAAGSATVGVALGERPGAVAAALFDLDQSLFDARENCLCPVGHPHLA